MAFRFLSFDLVSTWFLARIKRPQGIGRGLLVGIGAAHCITEEKKIHLPLALLMPGVYCGATVWFGWNELVTDSKAIVNGTKILAATEAKKAAATAASIQSL